MKKIVLSSRPKAGMIMAAVGGLLTFTVALAPPTTRAVVLQHQPTGTKNYPELARTTCLPQRCGRSCVPNEIIIKFRRPAANTIEEQLALANSSACPHLSCDLDQLNARYAVREIRPFLKDFRRKQQQLKSLREKSNARPKAGISNLKSQISNSVASAAGLTQKEKDILRKLKRAPTGAKVPDLDRIYRIKLDCGCDQGRDCRLEEILEAYRSDPDVEYAELNYCFVIIKG